MGHESLSRTIYEPQDEQYTRYEDIAQEVSTYPLSVFRNRTVYCNCDGPGSNFYRFFRTNFSDMGLKKLICTSYEGWGCVMDRKGYREFALRDGDFASAEVRPFLEECDIVVTNPPFSLYRKFIDLVLVRYRKDVLLVGPQHILHYKEVFPLFAGGVIRTGNTPISTFILPSGGTKKHGNMKWFTTFKTLPKKPLPGTDRYDPNDYPRYIGKDVIYVPDIRQVPLGYPGLMGVPESVFFFDHYRYDILGTICDKTEDDRDHREYERILIRLKPRYRRGRA